MLELLIFFILCYALSSIIVQQKVFEEARNWIKRCSIDNSNWFQRKICQLVSCMFCTGFWSGIFITLIGFNIIIITGSFLVTCFVHGLLGAFGSYLLHLLMGFLIVKAQEKRIDT